MDNKLTIHPKTVKGEDGYKVFSIRVKESTITKIDELANRSGRSRNELIGMLLNFALENCEIQNEYRRSVCFHS